MNSADAIMEKNRLEREALLKSLRDDDDPATLGDLKELEKKFVKILKAMKKGGRRTRGKLRARSRPKSRKKRRKSRRKSKGRKRRRKKRTKRRRKR